MTGGMAFEGLNNLGHSGSKAIIVLNDNGRSYAPTVSKLGESLARLRLNPTYLQAAGPARPRARTRCRVVGDQLERGLDGAEAAIREMFEPPAFFETSASATPARSTATTSTASSEALRNAAEYDGPIVVHVLTQKGRGYAPAENDADQAPARHRVRAPQAAAATPPRSPRR